MATPTPEYSDKVKTLAQQLAYNGGVPQAGANLLARFIVSFEERLDALEKRATKEGVR